MALTSQFARAAPEVVFSHARTVDEHPSAPSPLLPAGPRVDDGDGPTVASTAQRQFALRAPCESVADDAAPALSDGVSVRGGAAVIEAQSDCPFKAMAAFRLATPTWPAPVDGLSPIERGVLVHAAMAAFWSLVKRHDVLLAMSRETFDRTVQQAAEAGLVELSPSRWRVLPPLVRAGEAARLANLVWAWVDGYERRRHPFTAVDTEAKLPLELNGLHLELRLDRIDALEGGGVAIVDYKTGEVPPISGWFTPRPRAPQLGLYALAHEAAHPDRALRAVAYAQLKPGKLALRGIAADSEAWPKLRAATTLKGDAGISDWRDVEARWATILGDLGIDFIGGAAAVAPRDKKETCAHCRRQALCRIGAPAIEDREADDDE
jgi:RecB family exonuclease